jgi:hypothetical protein
VTVKVGISSLIFLFFLNINQNRIYI